MSFLEVKDLELNTNNVKREGIYGCFLPYYVDPVSMELKVILKKIVALGSYTRTGNSYAYVIPKLRLPEDKNITIEDAFKQIDIGAEFNNSFLTGSVMPDIENSDKVYEMVLVQVTPPKKLNEEFGDIPFDELLGAIQQGLIQDLPTRMLLSELYIMALEENRAAAQEEPKEVSDAPLAKTTDIAEEVIEQNKQTDFGKIYS